MSLRPFPSWSKPLFQSETKCAAIDMKMVFYSNANKTHFHMKGFALSLVLKVRVFETRKWSIDGRRNLILVTRSLALVVMSMHMSSFCEYMSRVISSIIFVFVYLLFDFIRFCTKIKKRKKKC